MQLMKTGPDIIKEEAGPEESAFSIYPTFEIEMDLAGRGNRIIAGIDEAGRGALAGPLSVGLVVYRDSFFQGPPEGFFRSVRDSKKLTPAGRSAACGLVEQYSLYHAVKLVSHRIIDRLNVNGATAFAITRLLKEMPFRPDILLIDGRFNFDVGVPFMSVVRGDSLSGTISSASVIAKVTRDRVMERIDTLYPDYCFRQNKGYGTKKHISALHARGFSRVHRRSYDPVRSMIERGQRET